jgi:hypothetical protein
LNGGDLPENCIEAYISLKNSLISKPIVDYPRTLRPYSLIMEASTGTDEIKGGLVAMRCPKDEEGEERDIAYASRKL